MRNSRLSAAVGWHEEHAGGFLRAAAQSAAVSRSSIEGSAMAYEAVGKERRRKRREEIGREASEGRGDVACLLPATHSLFVGRRVGGRRSTLRATD